MSKTPSRESPEMLASLSLLVALAFLQTVERAGPRARPPAYGAVLVGRER